jgi:hypothetical protein
MYQNKYLKYKNKYINKKYNKKQNAYKIDESDIFENNTVKATKNISQSGGLLVSTNRQQMQRSYHQPLGSPAPFSYEIAALPQKYQPAPVAQIYQPTPAAQIYQPAPAAQKYQHAPAAQIYQHAPAAQIFQHAPAAQIFQPAPAAQIYQHAPAAQIYQHAPAAQIYQHAPAAQIYQHAPAAQIYQPAPFLYGIAADPRSRGYSTHAPFPPEILSSNDLNTRFDPIKVYLKEDSIEHYRRIIIDETANIKKCNNLLLHKDLTNSTFLDNFSHKIVQGKYTIDETLKQKLNSDGYENMKTSGSYGTIYTKDNVLVKEINLPEDLLLLIIFYNYQSIYGLIPKIYDLYFNESKFYIFMEKYTSDLYTYVKKYKSISNLWDTTKEKLNNLLEKLFDAGLICGDIKLKNLVIDESAGNIRFIDIEPDTCLCFCSEKDFTDKQLYLDTNLAYLKLSFCNLLENEFIKDDFSDKLYHYLVKFVEINKYDHSKFAPALSYLRKLYVGGYGEYIYLSVDEYDKYIANKKLESILSFFSTILVNKLNSIKNYAIVRDYLTTVTRILKLIEFYPPESHTLNNFYKDILFILYSILIFDMATLFRYYIMDILCYYKKRINYKIYKYIIYNMGKLLKYFQFDKIVGDCPNNINLQELEI